MTDQTDRQRALALFELGRHAEARAAAAPAVAAQPTDELLWDLLIRCDVELDGPERALATGRRALGHLPESAQIHVLMSFAASRSGDAETAIEHGASAIEHGASAIRAAPSWHAGYVASAQAWLDQRFGDADRQAAFHLANADRLAPGHPSIQITRANLLAHEGRVQGAKMMLEEVLRQDPTNREAQLRLADLNLHTLDAGAASDLIHAALALDPDDAEARTRLDRLIQEAMVSLAWLSGVVGVGLVLVLGLLFGEASA